MWVIIFKVLFSLIVIVKVVKGEIGIFFDGDLVWFICRGKVCIVVIFRVFRNSKFIFVDGVVITELFEIFLIDL